MTAADITTPQSFGPYEVEYLLGRGAMGAVYASRDRRIGRRVALKTIQLPAGQFEDATAMNEYFLRLQREAELSGSLLHPNIVTLYEVGYENGRISYLAMELVETETLQQMMKRLRPEAVPVDVALGITADVLRGLALAHQRSIVHRDIKPANILIAADGVAKIADFGIARPQSSSITKAGSLIGTPNYMSPEQVVGAGVTERADVFSTGAMLYEMLTGVKPFAANDIAAILHNVLRLEPPHVSDVNPRVPRHAGDFVARLMAKSAEARPSAAEALASLNGPRVSSPALAPAAVTPLRTPALRSTVPTRLFVATIALLLTVTIFAIVVIRARTDPTPTVTIPAERLSEFEEKRLALEEADVMLNSGRFEESLGRYESYLQRYPHSTAAEAGRDRALAEIERNTAPPSAQPARAVAKKKPKSKKDEDISPREMLDRIKKVFRP